MKRRILPRGFWVYTGLLLLAVLALYPVQVTVLENTVEQYGMELPVSAQLLAVVNLVVPFLLGLIGILVGQKWAPKLGLRSLVYEKLDWNRSVADDFKRALPIALLGGAGVGLLILGFDWWMAPVLPDVFTFRIQAPGAWEFILELLYGGVAEELMLRFGFMTAMVYLFTRFGRAKSTLPYALAIFISAFLFALGHYSATASVTEMTNIVWFRMLFLNGIGGLLFGWLYYRYHLEAAIVAHMSTHVAMNLVMLGLAAFTR
ncbi:CPBP family intramembrane glutamic endopeptidase [Atopococcus tabaci]|uniref:CPBP family intramembrane glutamic endopeptidase n=1 Tax=Atopococcus tabaci TaxID=269774 RepID=UPI00040885A5|nr:CPBP family intramembrane glutamic endopeptidase [Atopococcus tabaci]